MIGTYALSAGYYDAFYASAKGAHGHRREHAACSSAST